MLNKSLSIITNVLVFSYKATGRGGKQSTALQLVAHKHYPHIPAIEQLDYAVHDITRDIARQMRDMSSNLSRRDQLIPAMERL